MRGFSQAVVLLFGAGVVVSTLLSAVTTVILPRGTSSRLSRAVFGSTLWVFRKLASERRDFEDRDRVMALFAPVALVMLPLAWVSMVLLGFTAVFWGLGDTSWGDAFFTSGSNLLTLGFAPVEGTLHRLLAFVEATLGLGLVALLVTFLPSLYGTFSRRETAVALLAVRAGTPPSAVEFLSRLHRIGWLDRLPETWERWETWFAELEESHISYPALNYFRSPDASRSWVVAAGIVLDAASLTVSALDVERQPEAQLCIRAGFLSLRSIAAYFGIAFDLDPDPGDPISIARSEFEEACVRLESAGLPMRPDRDRAWRDFAGWRVNYDQPLLALAELTMAPYAPWTSDRSAPDHTEPHIHRWGLRRSRLEPLSTDDDAV